MEELKEASDTIEEDIYGVLSPYEAVKRRKSLGGTGFDQVEKQIQAAKELLK
jgi:argininosuccinate lyase